MKTSKSTFDRFTYSYAAAAYQGYLSQAGGKSLITGEKLPDFEALPTSVKEAWGAAASAVLKKANTEEGWS